MQSYRNPHAQWLGSPNFTADRDGHDMAIQPAYVVMHTMVGTVTGANARFQQASEQASATYGIGLDGRLYQWVDERDAPWTNGTWSNPGSNGDSITIEHEDGGDYDGPRTPELYAASAALVRDICLRYSIPIDRQHVIEHRECNGASTSCPDALDVNRIVAAAGSPAASPRTGGSGMGFASPDVNGEALWEVYVSGGEAYWGVFPGGAGEWVSYPGSLPELGSPEGAFELIRADGVATTHAGALRFNVRAVDSVGRRWVKVMNPSSPFNVILDWTLAGAGPAEDVPGSAPDAALRAYLKDGPS